MATANNLGDIKLEIRALKALTSDNENLQSMAFSRLRDDTFSFPPAQEAFARIKAYAKMGAIPAWENFLSDTRLSDDSVQALTAITVTGPKSRAEADIIFNELHQYRAVRSVYEMAEDIYTAVKSKSKLEVVGMLDMIAERVANARIVGNAEDNLIRTGDAQGAKALLKVMQKVHKGQGVTTIPTGFDSFDRINIGVPDGSCFVIGAPSGEGKSVLAVNLATAMATSGAKVCLVSLEMNREQVWIRIIASLLALKVNDISTNKLSIQKWDEIERAVKILGASLRLSKGMLDIYTPEVDPDIEELLFGLKPYGYKVIIIDYLSLLRGFDGDQFWLKLGNAVRLCKRFAEINGMTIVPVVQTDEDGKARFSGMIKDNASLMWTWGKVKDDKKAKPDQMETFDVQMPKSRNQTPFLMKLYRRFDLMQITDNVHAIGKRWIEKIPYYDILEKMSDEELEDTGVVHADQKHRDWLAKRSKSLRAKFAADRTKRTTAVKQRDYYIGWRRGRDMDYSRRKVTSQRVANASPARPVARAQVVGGFGSKTIALRGYSAGRT